ncbi:MAG: ankyrin repeat domain-containing protein [Gammaproteobacteria bacterium]
MELTIGMLNVSKIRRGAAPILLGLACALGPGVVLAAGDLADAAMREDNAAVERLISSKADVNEAQPDGTTALHWAAYHGDAKLAAKLLAKKANPSALTDTGITPMSLACENGNPDVVRALLKAGADANQTLTNGETPLMMAARTGRVQILEVLLANGASIDAKEKLRGTTALMWAAANSNPDAVRYLVSKGADLNAHSATTPPGRNPYLAPPGRERIQEFIDGTGLRGAIVEQDKQDTKNPQSKEDEAKAREEAKKKFDEEVAAAKAAVSKFPKPAPYSKRGAKQFGGLTPLLFAAREGDMASVKILLDAGANVNQTSEYGWTALLVATQNRYYKLGAFLLQHGADPNIQNLGGWNPLYIATDNRNIERGEYPTRKPDMDHLEYIKLLLAAKANPNQRMHSSTETRTVFTNQWLYEEGATPFLRAAQSGDIVLMKLLLENGADPSIPTDHKVTPLMVASGIGWVEGVTYEWSPAQTLEAVKMLLDLGAKPNEQDDLDGRTALMGAAHKGRDDVVRLLVDRGADLSLHDIGSRDSIHALSGITWQAIDYSDGLVRVGVQSAIGHPETSKLLRQLMVARNLAVPPEGRTLASICITDLCK